MQAGAELPGSCIGRAHCWAGGRSGGGELLQSIVLLSIWPVSGYLALRCLGGKASGTAVCVVGGIVWAGLLA